SLKGERLTVGKFATIKTAKALLVGVITDVSIAASSPAKDVDNYGTAHLDLMGEIRVRAGRSGPGQFHRGVTDYPTIGDSAAPLTNDEMRAIFDTFGSRSIKVGHLQQDNAIGVSVDVDELLSKHFAVLGTTGVGKSSAVTLILHQVLRARPDLRVLL